MKSFYVIAAPMPLVIGGFSHGTHVATTTPQAAAEVAVRLGFVPNEVIECPDTFDCTCVEDNKPQGW